MPLAGRARSIDPPRLTMMIAVVWKRLYNSSPMLSFLLLLLLMRAGAASAGDCLVTAPPYQLQSDTVEWQMRTRVGLRGIRLKLVANPTITIISPPRFGALSVQGPSFSYTPGTNFGDEDSFVLEVAGSIRKASGVSIIRVAVSNSDATDPRHDPALTPK